jgi:hypothetical protein
LGPRVGTTSEQREIIELCGKKKIPVAKSTLPYRGDDTTGPTVEAVVKELRESDRRCAELIINLPPEKRAIQMPSRYEVMTTYWNKIEKEAKVWEESRRRRKKK